ncbi:nuclear transport factor 2 family protein [Kurthia sibirica]|uniref:DUF4440 domain-containing protein n=1 Tax=Kurthia sibirica TaxID=202750 RepID=A0A2U3AML3_9BACL|nr:nuclear transport factor 2 family protein [Kurthia sibirica]PWI25783.1 hypothetical protein DEX24_06160 [Kurthia sibirica]GEK35103.1 hypothetical protein KSI01_26360 [Kurthia sibirica]
MSLKQIAFSAACILMLAGCGNDSTKDATNSSSTIDDGEKSSTEIVQKNEVEQQAETKQIDEGKVVTPPVESTQKSESTDQESNDETETTEPIGKKDDATSTVSSGKADGTTKQKQQTNEANDESGGFSVVDGQVSAAVNIPQQDEQEILSAFQEYIDAFNAKDIKRYEKVLATSPQGFDLAEDLTSTKTIFANYDIHRTVENVTITDYSATSAFVYADIIIEVKQDNNEAKDEGKQLTQFIKEDGQWRVTSLQAIGNATNAQ